MIWWFVSIFAVAIVMTVFVMTFFAINPIVDETEGLEEWSGALPETRIDLDCFAPDSQTKAVRITQRRS